MTAEWIMFPDYRESVPYQGLLSQELPPVFRVTSAWLDAGVVQRARDGNVVFHLHWQDGIYNRASDLIEAEALVTRFQENIEAFKSAGGVFLWTVHNLTPHEDQYPSAERLLKSVIIKNADFIHVHNRTTAESLKELGQVSENIIHYPCPSLASFYPNSVSSAEARAYFSLSETSTVFAFLGMIRKYKGVDILKDAFKRVKSQGRNVALILAGQSDRSTKSRFIISDGVHVIPRFIEDSTVQYVFNAADYGVIPYRQVTTSAALMLGLGFGKPMLVPELPQVLDIVTPGREVITFNPGSVDDLERALCLACDISQVKYREMSKSAYATSASLTFSDLAKALSDEVFRIKRHP